MLQMNYNIAQDMFSGLQATSDPLSPMLQLPHVDAGLLKKLSRSGVKQLSDLMGMDSIARLQALQSAGEGPAFKGSKLPLLCLPAVLPIGCCCAYRAVGKGPGRGSAGGVLQAKLSLST